MQIFYTDKEAKKGYTFLVYGDAGTGKTLDIANLPNPFIISLENGLLTLKDKNIPFVKINSWIEFTKAVEYYFENYEKEFKDTFLCIDSLTIASDLAYEHFRSLYPNDSYKKFFELGDAMVKLCNSIQQKGKKVYITAQVNKYQDDNKRLYISPWFNGEKLSKKIPHIFDFVFYKKIEKQGDKIRYLLQTQKDYFAEAKSRIEFKKKEYESVKEIVDEIEAIYATPASKQQPPAKV